MSALIENKKSRLNYEILEVFEAGIELRGFEVKALKKGQGSLAGAYISARGGELFLIGAHVSPYQPHNTPAGYDPERPRRLLLTKKEIAEIVGKEGERGVAIIPTRVYLKGKNIKVAVAVARGRKKYDKRQVIREREDKRRTERLMKGGS